ncbi:serine hydroxymethyltransferase [bacterium (Candidatus Gribaldobacteria) CG08_land_8_20_14_0_20_39_15]|uniref:Serine hydroxymethyltransferase n=1 Tax=bacterium (Candidatus Gribaldobacteria) CG08_land_8_20_14_0_20_39_15 TaxID=2014273 RepID=A0A2M6XUQ4_9BACT|nr:MAG: serine hydroxymethyltransferase [bacterium (Candidatus Gribaldobacteria) CG08_land_8_20_14_0_20_39_15]
MLNKTDPQIAALIKAEQKRQSQTLMLIPSENHTSCAVREAVGSLLQDKYCEGYPFKRYYQGQENYDKIEELCRERVRRAFGVPYCNVQPLSGAPANLAVYFALLKPGDKIMGLRVDQGGHITHGLKVNASGTFFNSVFYYVNEQGVIDYQALEEIALKEKPKIIIAGITSYPLALDFQRFSQIAQKSGALLMGDVSHVAGLILADVYPNPVPYCHVITTTTHKTLRGPRGALIMVTNKGLKSDPAMGDKIDKAVFPGLQGGPHENNIAGIAVALKEAQKPAFKKYGKQVVKNAAYLADCLKKGGLKLCAGGTNTHLLVIDLREFKITGNTIAGALEKGSIVVNRNNVPYDPNPPFYPSGIRLGTPAVTSQGMKEKEMKVIAGLIVDIIKDIIGLKNNLKLGLEDEKKKANRDKIIAQSAVVKKSQQKVKQLCAKFPLPKQY